jgi:hypothetical protein
VVITGLTAADTSGGTDTLVEGTDKVKVTLKADAQQSGATAVAAHTGVPVVVPPETADPPAYVVVATAGDVDDVTKIHYTSASKSLKYQTTGDGSATTKTLDEDFDAALIAVLSNLVNTDTVEFDANGNANAVVFTIAPTAAAKLQAVLDNVGGMTPGVTLGADTTIAADVAVPAGKTLTIAASKTLTVSAAKTLTLAAGATVTLPDTAILTLAKTALITLADNTSVINVGATANNKFAIKGDSTGASTLTAGGTGSETVSLSGIAAGSTILGSANSATLAITGNDAEIAVAAATNGLTIDAVTVDVSAKGKITIGNGGKVTLAASGGGIKTGGNSGSGGESNYATGSTTGIAGTVNGCSITGAANDNNNIDKNDTFVSSSSGTVAVTPAS